MHLQVIPAPALAAGRVSIGDVLALAWTSQHKRANGPTVKDTVILPIACSQSGQDTSHTPLYISQFPSSTGGYVLIASNCADTKAFTIFRGTGQARINCREDPAPDEPALGEVGIGSLNGQFPQQNVTAAS